MIPSPSRPTVRETHWVEAHGVLRRGVRGGVAGLRVVAVALAIVVLREQGEQDDGDNLQAQRQDGELYPHGGGVRRHPDVPLSVHCCAAVLWSSLSLSPLSCLSLARTLTHRRLPPASLSTYPCQGSGLV